MTQRYDGANRLRRTHGMRGYGIYCRIVELCDAAPNKKLRYDLDDLVFDLREDKNLVKNVVENFDLFVIEGEFIEDVYARSPEALERERQALIRANRSAAAKRAAQTRRERRGANLPLLETSETAQTNGHVNANVPARVAATNAPSSQVKPAFNPGVPAPPQRAPLSANRTPALRNDRAATAPTAEAERFNKVKGIWNEVFKGTRRTMIDAMSDEVAWMNFMDSSQYYTDQDYREAFEQARHDKKFTWQFRDALKRMNVQRLLSEAEAIEMRKQEEYEALDEATKEMIEFGDRMGLNWSEESKKRIARQREQAKREQ